MAKTKKVDADPRRKGSWRPSEIRHRGTTWESTLTAWLETRSPELDELGELLEAGATIGSACARVGVPQTVVLRWISEGRKDHNAGVHSVKSRFWEFIARRIAVARAVTEVELRKLNPAKWLQCGPGRVIDDQWTREEFQEETQAGNRIANGNALAGLLGAAMQELIQAGINTVPSPAPVLGVEYRTDLASGKTD